MDTYTIKKAYHWTDRQDIEINSENLLFIETNSLVGCQIRNQNNETQILNKLKQISKLIKEVDELNK